MTAALKPDVRRVATGLPGLDEVADGGLPRGQITVVVGGAGSGKTIFGLQVLCNGARQYQEPGILVAFEETADHIRANTAGFDWSTAGVHFLDAQLSQAVEQGGEFDLIGLLGLVAAKAKQTGAKRVVFDGLDVLLDYLGDPGLVRREAFRLREWVQQTGLTVLMTAKADSTDARVGSDYDFLQFMADCVLSLHHRVVHGTALRFIRVAKYRGAAHSANELPITITENGIEVAMNTGVELSYPVSDERISTGIERLDAMLLGGYHRGSSVLITGAPGTAKTTLAASFAEAAVRRGEATLYLSFDEAPDQIVRDVASVGIDLRRWVQPGLLSLHSFRGRTESPQAHLVRIRQLLRASKARNLIIDGVSPLAQSCAEAASPALEIVDFAKSAGITILSTSLLGSAGVSLEQTPFDISNIADTWMQLSYAIQGGERNRALTIIKSRGTGHSNQVRELVLSSEGVTLADVYSVGGEVLMGTLRWEKENLARRAQVRAQDDALLRERKAQAALAETRSKIDVLIHERAIREAELSQVRVDSAAEDTHHAGEAAALLNRRGADPAGEPAPPPLPQEGEPR